MIKFKAVIHPFYQEIKITGMKNMNEETFETTYDCLDEWGGFEMFGYTFDYHFLYDAEPEFYIEAVDPHNDLAYEWKQSVKLIIEI